MRSSDLSTLFGATAAGAQLGQGVILSWDPNTGSNTVDWAGTILTDVPMLNTAEAITFKPGHVVVLLGQGGSWFIIGRVTKPGDPSFASASVAFDAKNAQFTNFGLTTSLVNDAFVNINVPAWADQMAVMAIGSCTLVNTTATADFASCAVFIDGVTGPGVQCGFAPNTDATIKNNHVGTMTASSTRVMAVTGGASIQCDLRIRSQTNPWSASGTNIAEISAMAIFKSTV